MGNFIRHFMGINLFSRFGDYYKNFKAYLNILLNQQDFLSLAQIIDKINEIVY